MEPFAFRIGYLGEGFYGFARQPGRPTVEGTLVEGLEQRGLLDPSTPLQVASRTDRGVHALGNVISFVPRVPGPSAARALSALHPAIFCRGYAPVPPGFDPRHARSRRYRYFDRGKADALETYREGAELFRGEHEFSSFGRRDEPPRPTRRRVDRFELQTRGPDLVLEVEAPGFLWGQVRKMVSALRALSEGKLSLRALSESLEGRRRLSLPLAEPEALVLAEVRYDFPWREPDPAGRGRWRRRWEAAREDARLRWTLLGEFQETLGGERSEP